MANKTRGTGKPTAAQKKMFTSRVLASEKESPAPLGKIAPRTGKARVDNSASRDPVCITCLSPRPAGSYVVCRLCQAKEAA